MSDVKVAVVFYSATSTNFKVAKAVALGAEEAGAEVRLRRVPELAPDEAIDSNPLWRANVESMADIPLVDLADLEWADAIILGTPTRFGNMAAQMKQFIDTTGGLWFQGKLANKVAAAFTSSQNEHGGQETALLSLQTTFYHWGCIIVPPGYTDEAVFANGGNPYGVSTNSVTDSDIPDTAKAAAHHLAHRVVQVAGWIGNGQAE